MLGRSIITTLLSVLVCGTIAHAETVRFAVIVGSNQGGKQTKALRFAEKDAQRFARTLQEVGGVLPQNVITIASAGATEVRRAFDSVELRLRKARQSEGTRTVLLFFYSGHSDGLHLELGAKDKLPFAEVRERLERSAAHVRLAFIDSCKSGGITEDKGLAPGPNFDLSVFDETDVDGAAFITSSSASERAQESSEIGGSFFTHFLVSALRGAADSDSNGRVTLSEAYQYAFAKTVSQTARTVVGAQHPSYAYKLSGRGDLTLADLRGAPAILYFPAGNGGTYLVIDEGHNELVAEVLLPPKESRRLGVPAGHYLVGQRQGDVFMAARVYAAMAQESVVKAEDMRGTPLALGKGKGDELWLTNSVSGSYTLVAGALGGFQAANEVLAGFRHALQSNWSLAQRLGIGFADIEASGLRYQYRAYLADVALLHRLEFPSLQVLFGPSVGVAYSEQTLFSGERQAGALFRYGGLATLVFPLAGRLSAEVTWDAGGTALRLNGQLVQRLLVRAGIGVNYGF